MASARGAAAIRYGAIHAAGTGVVLGCAGSLQLDCMPGSANRTSAISRVAFEGAKDDAVAGPGAQAPRRIEGTMQTGSIGGTGMSADGGRGPSDSAGIGGSAAPRGGITGPLGTWTSGAAPTTGGREAEAVAAAERAAERRRRRPPKSELQGAEPRLRSWNPRLLRPSHPVSKGVCSLA